MLITFSFADQQYFPCNLCVQLFPDNKSLKTHLKNKHAPLQKKKKYSCTLCSYSTDKKSDLKRHVVTHTKVKSHKCDQCSKCFTRKSDLTRHLKRQHILELSNESRFACVECGKQFVLGSSLIAHMKSHHPVNPFSYSFCDKSLAGSS